MSVYDTTIYIPTYRRTNQLTFSYLPHEWQQSTFLVCDEEDAQHLRAAGYPVLVCPHEGIGPTRQWIIDQHDTEAHGENLIMMDDDLRFSRRRTDDPTKFIQMRYEPGDSDQINVMLYYLATLVEEVPLAGIINRGGANRNADPIRLDTRLHDLLAIHVPTFRAEGIQFNRLEFMEDFDVALQFLTKGYHTAALGMFCKDDQGSNVNGGCSVYRTVDRQNAAALDLHLMFPEVVRLTRKTTWDTMGERMDVAVQWKKAYKIGTKNRELLGLPAVPEPDLSMFDLV